MKTGMFVRIAAKVWRYRVLEWIIGKWKWTNRILLKIITFKFKICWKKIHKNFLFLPLTLVSGQRSCHKFKIEFSLEIQMLSPLEMKKKGLCQKIFKTKSQICLTIFLKTSYIVFHIKTSLLFKKKIPCKIESLWEISTDSIWRLAWNPLTNEELKDNVWRH